MYPYTSLNTTLCVEGTTQMHGFDCPGMSDGGLDRFLHILLEIDSFINKSII